MAPAHRARLRELCHSTTADLLRSAAYPLTDQAACDMWFAGLPSCATGGSPHDVRRATRPEPSSPELRTAACSADIPARARRMILRRLTLDRRARPASAWTSHR